MVFLTFIHFKQSKPQIQFESGIVAHHNSEEFWKKQKPFCNTWNINGRNGKPFRYTSTSIKKTSQNTD